MKRIYYDENVFPKVDRAVSRWNFLFYFKSNKFSNLYVKDILHRVRPGRLRSNRAVCFTTGLGHAWQFPHGK